MNRYPLWKYVLMVLAILFGTFYTLPNFFGESPAVQISSAKSTLKLTSGVMTQAQDALQKGGLAPESILFDNSGVQASVRARFANTDQQFKAKALLEHALNTDPTDPTYVIAFNLLPNTPSWLQAVHAFPMFLGLDLRGGVHFLMQVDSRHPGVVSIAGNHQMSSGVHKHLVKAQGVLVPFHAPFAHFSLVNS